MFSSLALTSKMERTIDAIDAHLPLHIPKDMKEFAEIKWPAILDCPSCTRPSKTNGPSKNIRPCVITFTSVLRQSCDSCHKNNHTCDGQFYTMAQLLWMLCRHFRGQSWEDPFDPLDGMSSDDEVNIVVDDLRVLRRAARVEMERVRRGRP